jgi:signal transduction histidine kinase
VTAQVAESAIFAGAQLADPALEEAYRRDSRAAENRVSQIGLSIGAANAVFLAGTDFNVAGSRGMLIRLLAFRLGFALFTVAMLVVAARAKATRGRDRALVLAGIGMVVVDWAVVSSRAPDGYLFLPLDAVMVFAIWTVLTVPFRWQAFVAALVSVNTAFLLACYRNPLPAAGYLSIVSAIVVAQIVGAVTSWHLHRTRRTSWWRSREIEAASRAKSVFMAGVSHEVLSPLAGIVAAARELRRTTPDVRDAATLAAIQTDGAALHALLTDVMALARAEVVVPEVRGGPVAPCEVLEDLHVRLSGSATAKGLALRIEAGSSVPAMVLADGARLQQVLSNLVSNAVRCTKSGEVSVTCRSAAEADGKPVLVFTVRDTGPGIPPADLPGLFEPFRQGRAPGGRAGLGLALAKQFAERMGGRIEVESTVGRGSTFRLTLPLVEAEPKAEVPPPGPLTGRDRVLVAEAQALAEAPSGAGARDLAERAARMATEVGDRELARWAEEVVVRAGALDADGLARTLRRLE